MTTLTDADIPGRNDGLAPLSTTVTGKLATPEVTVASSATSVTLPGTASLDPAATTCAVCPTAISLTSASLTEPVTSNTPGAMITIACVAEPLEPDDAPPVPPVEICSPSVTLTSSTRPPAGALSVAAATAACALVTLTWSISTWLWSIATCADDDEDPSSRAESDDLAFCHWTLSELTWPWD